MAKKSHKKEHKKKSSKKKRYRSSSSSSSVSTANTSDNDQWIEKKEKPVRVTSQTKIEADSWLDVICNSSKEPEKKNNSKHDDAEIAKARMNMPGQSSRELNPYWKNGGTGLPPTEPKKSHLKEFLKPKADDDDDYRKHQIKYASSSSSRQSWRKHDSKDGKHTLHPEKSHRCSYKRDKDYNDREHSSNHHSRHKDRDNEKDDKRRSHREHKNEKKYETNEETQTHDKNRDLLTSCSSKNENPNNILEENSENPLTDAELNELAAKQIKAELMGNTALAEELRRKLDSARNLSKSKEDEFSTGSKQKGDFVLLTRTSSKGYSYPVAPSKSDQNNDVRKKKRERVLTHEDGKRVRYFDDDDKYSLKSMFEKEMTTTAEDSNLEFVKLSRKVNSRDDEDDVFVERASEKRSSKKAVRETVRAINEHKRTEKILNSCRYCFDSEAMMKHLVIAKGEKCYVCLPSYKSLTEGHCLIVPIYHYACATDIDEDVWTEMQTFRKSLTSMFKDQDEDIVFFESAMQLNNMPHMVWNCVPVPIEIGDTAPIYFKKAILECETEWAINKKVVDLSSKDVRRAVPKSLPYFAVDFGMQGGYAHVIEDEKLFPNNFAEEIIGGMMDLDHNVWRKRQKEPIEEQLQKVTSFLEMWEKNHS
ncbi:CWF19-like protein 2 [Adelges cooleyi]|uniref:CWF19-like protein 2 n=1 Tax=Adelges cooleyi TaxID=133065 RepID=UPI00217FD9A4|nr:CWF19-like protein 2 [Adelges cooleyi]